ncbi:MbtH family protein [Streptomyces sp. WZ.A104]|uniref:MbtH family protein n=1 Tax=Streptomyces sp. WZ.A104 TaxID=2023771 RepID=UPI000BBC59BC|nr:MbtH family protein [Streptomyces sp. WZ.A104]PCG84413.1 MbtH family protein [Streptomyces sp. WZ.A104]
MNSPFDDTAEGGLVLRNDRGEYSVWPADITPPAGWRTVLAADERRACLDHIDTHWRTERRGAPPRAEQTDRAAK